MEQTIGVFVKNLVCEVDLIQKNVIKMLAVKDSEKCKAYEERDKELAEKDQNESRLKDILKACKEQGKQITERKNYTNTLEKVMEQKEEILMKLSSDLNEQKFLNTYLEVEMNQGGVLIKKLNNTLDQLKDDINENNSTIKEMKGVIIQNEKQIREQNKIIFDQSSDNNLLTKSYLQMKDENEIIKDFDLKKDQIKYLENKLSYLENEVNEQSKRITEQDIEIEALNKKDKWNIDEILKLKIENIENNISIGSLEKEIATQDGVIGTLRDDKNENQIKYDAQKVKIYDLFKQQKEEIHFKFKQDIEELTLKLEESETKYKASENKVDDFKRLENKIAQKEATIQDISLKLSRSDVKLRDKETEFKTNIVLINELEDKLNEMAELKTDKYTDQKRKHARQDIENKLVHQCTESQPFVTNTRSVKVVFKNKVYIRSLNTSTAALAIQNALSQFGAIESVNRPDSKSFSFVTFKYEESVALALERGCLDIGSSKVYIRQAFSLI